MERIHSTLCTAEQAGAFMRNSWKYAKVGGSHVRIHPPTSDVSVLPPGPVRYVAAVEILDTEDPTWGSADAAGIAAISEVFGQILKS